MPENKYRISILCDYPQWWRYNVYISIVCYNSQNEVTDYVNFVDESPLNGENTVKHREISALSAPCHHAALYLYVIANTLPESTIIRDCPPFDAELSVWRNDELISKKPYEVNQWGGVTLSGMPLE